MLFSSAAARGPTRCYYFSRVSLSDFFRSFDIYNIYRYIKLTFCHPKMLQAPPDSISKTPRTAVAEAGRWAPRSAHARPSRIRYFTRSCNASGTSRSEREEIHEHNLPVQPLGSVGGDIVFSSDDCEVDVSLNWISNEGG